MVILFIIGVAVIAIVGIIVYMMISENKRKEKLNDRRHYPIRMKDYTPILLLKQIPSDHIGRMIEEHIALCGEPVEINDFSWTLVAGSDWYKVHFPENITFYGFHNLVNWFYFTVEGCTQAASVLGLMWHRSDDHHSYYVEKAPEVIGGDTVMGAMNNGKYFSVYLPESYEEEGNMMIETERLTSDIVAKTLESYGLQPNQVRD